MLHNLHHLNQQHVNHLIRNYDNDLNRHHDDGEKHDLHIQNLFHNGDLIHYGDLLNDDFHFDYHNLLVVQQCNLQLHHLQHSIIHSFYSFLKVFDYFYLLKYFNILFIDSLSLHRFDSIMTYCSQHYDSKERFFIQCLFSNTLKTIKLLFHCSRVLNNFPFLLLMLKWDLINIDFFI